MSSSAGAYLGVVLAAGRGGKDEPSWERRPDIQLLVTSTGSQVVAVGGGASRSCEGCDTVWALIDQVDQGR